MWKLIRREVPLLLHLRWLNLSISLSLNLTQGNLRLNLSQWPVEEEEAQSAQHLRLRHL